MRAAAISVFVFVGFCSLAIATQTVASIFRDQPALGAPMLRLQGAAAYWPWSIVGWSRQWRARYPRPFALADFIVMCGFSVGAIAAFAAEGAGIPRLRRHGHSDIAIRTRPPSPKRLSRKVLLAGAGAAGLVIVFAVISGLSANAPRSGARQQGEAAQNAPPESIAQASSQYDASDLTRGDRSAMMTSDMSPNALAPPQDAMWSGQPSDQQTGSAPARPSAPDPETAAHSSPILFASSSSGSVETGDAPRMRADDRLEAALSPPRSPYEVQAGAVIPAALITGLNSDLPGRVIAQVTASVYDSVTGAHLLIPQGARLIGAYDNSVHYGDQRIVLVWNRLIMPNGWSIDLQDMPGADPTGAAGVSDETNNHPWRLGGAIGLSAIISVIANNSEEERRSQSLTQSLGDAAAQQAAQTGARIVERELAVHPTLQVRPGASVRVLVTRDIALRPYVDGRGDGGRPTP